MDFSPPGSSVHGVLQTRILEWVAIPFSTGSSWPRDWTQASCIVLLFFFLWWQPVICATRNLSPHCSSLGIHTTPFPWMSDWVHSREKRVWSKLVQLTWSPEVLGDPCGMKNSNGSSSELLAASCWPQQPVCRSGRAESAPKPAS